MKANKLLITFLAISTLMTSCKKENDDIGEGSTPKLKKMIFTEEGEDRTGTLELHYGANGFVDKMTCKEMKKNEVEQSITTFEYNSKNQIIKETKKR